MEPTAVETALSALQTSAIGQINSAVPVAFAIFGVPFGIALIFKIVKMGKK